MIYKTTDVSNEEIVEKCGSCRWRYATGLRRLRKTCWACKYAGPYNGDKESKWEAKLGEDDNV